MVQTKGISMENKEMSTPPSRPLILELRDAKQEMMDAVNGVLQKHQIPCFFMRGILEYIRVSVKNIEIQEFITSEEQYSAAVVKIQDIDI